MPQIAIALAVSAGGMALQYLLTPRQRQQPVDKGKLDDIRIQGSDYGTFIPRLLSGRARLAGNVLVHTGIETHTQTSTSNGGKKGGGNVTTRTYTYTTSLGVLVCRGVIGSFEKIWDGNQLLINNTPGATGLFEAEDATLAGTAAAYADATASPPGGTGEAVNGLGGVGNTATFDFTSVADPTYPNGDPEEVFLAFSLFTIVYKNATDQSATITTDGTPQTITLHNSGSSWTAKHVEVEGFVDTLVYGYTSATSDIDYIHIEKIWRPSGLLGKVPFPVTGVVNPNIAYPPDLDDPTGYYNYDAELLKSGTGVYSLTTPAPGMSIYYYTGTETQTANDRIKTWLDARYGTGQGVLRASAMRGLAWVMFQDFTLKETSTPNLTFEINKGTDTLNEALVLLFTDVGLSAGDYDVTATAAVTQYGLLEHTNQSRRQLIESYARYHGFRLGEVDGKIKVILDTSTAVATLSATKLRAHKAGEDAPNHDAEVIVKEPLLLPREVRVSVMNPDLEYHNDVATAQLFTVPGTESVEYTFPIIDTLATARNKAERLLLKTHIESKAIEVSGMPEYAQYTIGDVINIPINGTNYLCRIEKKQMPLPLGPVRLQCVVTGYINADNIFQDDVTSLSTMAARDFAPSTFPRNSVVFIIPSKPIREADVGRVGVYLAVCGRGRGDGVRASLCRETDEDNFVLQQVVETPAVLGICEDTLANHGPGPNVEDTTSVLDIWFFNDIDLETVTQTDIDRLPTINLLRVGDEWIQFRTATPQTLEATSPYRSKWRVTNLWRGRFGTDGEIGSHAAGEYAALATPSLIFYELERDDIGETVSFKAVTEGQDVALAPISSFTFTAPVSAYEITNDATDRRFDANSTTINELADVLATVIKDSNL